MLSKFIIKQANRANAIAPGRALSNHTWANQSQASFLLNTRAATFFTLARSQANPKSDSVNFNAKRFFSSAAQEDGSDNEDDAAVLTADEDEGDSQSKSGSFESAKRNSRGGNNNSDQRGGAIDISSI